MKNFIIFFALSGVIAIFAAVGIVTVVEQWKNRHTPIEKIGEGGQILTDTFQCTHVHESTFETPRFKTFEKRGMKLWIMEPDTYFTSKGNPLLLSGWKLTIDGNPRKKYRYGDFDKLSPEIQKLFWFKAD